MKLRNKKTGEIVDLSVGYIKNTDSGSSIQIKPVAISNKVGYLYNSLAELNDEWEDVEDINVPIIKDEKIRKAVRAWAEANDIDPERYYDTNVKFDFLEHRLKWIETSIEFNDISGLENLEDGERYTIAELCGEWEE